MSSHAEIPITRGLVVIVDAADAESVLAAGKWSADVRPHTAYARRIFRRDGRAVKVYLHRFLTGWPRVDHINLNGLDNRRANLRPATQVENNRNQQIRATNTSGYKGVSWQVRSSRWRATITAGGRQIHLGLFADPAQAARAYDEAAAMLHGDFARLNFPPGLTDSADTPGRGKSPIVA